MYPVNFLFLHFPRCLSLLICKSKMNDTVTDPLIVCTTPEERVRTAIQTLLGLGLIIVSSFKLGERCGRGELTCGYTRTRVAVEETVDAV